MLQRERSFESMRISIGRTCSNALPRFCCWASSWSSQDSSIIFFFLCENFFLQNWSRIKWTSLFSWCFLYLYWSFSSSSSALFFTISIDWKERKKQTNIDWKSNEAWRSMSLACFISSCQQQQRPVQRRFWIYWRYVVIWQQIFVV